MEDTQNTALIIRLQIQGGAEFIAPNGIQYSVFQILLLLIVCPCFIFPIPNKIKEMEGLYMYCHALHIFSPFIPYLFFFRSLINHSPGIIVVEQGRDDRGWLDVPQEGSESQLAVQNHFAPRGRVVHPGGAKSCTNRREPSRGSQRAMDGYITSILLCPSFVTGDPPCNDHSIPQ